MINSLKQQQTSGLRPLLALLGLLFLAASCSEGSNEETRNASADTVVVEEIPVLSKEEVLYKEVMDIHDQAMLGMSEIRHLRLQLNDSIENTGVSPMEQEETINLFRNRLQDLKSADEAMRQWMRGFDYKNVKKEEQLLYLQEEKVKITEVDRQMETAILQAREAMQK